ncbi:MAG: sensor histidine kinase, partial [Bdellovibrionales bacterium]|nr:sensor histidine kinase [Bdellovibrionales bacterium]
FAPLSDADNRRLLLPRDGLIQSVTALVKNSFDASAPGSTVALRCEYDRGMLKVTVTDTGSGMQASVLDRVREPFFTTKAPGSGMGLGLFLVDLFARRYGGSLMLSSYPERGTTALLSILAQEDAAESADAVHPAASPQGRARSAAHL